MTDIVLNPVNTFGLSEFNPTNIVICWVVRLVQVEFLQPISVTRRVSTT